MKIRVMLGSLVVDLSASIDGVLSAAKLMSFA